MRIDRKSTRLNSSHVEISYAVFCLKKKKVKRPLPSFYTQLHHTSVQRQDVVHIIGFVSVLELCLWLSVSKIVLIFFFFNDTAPTEIYTLSLHDALPISPGGPSVGPSPYRSRKFSSRPISARSEEHTSELQSRRELVCRLLLEKKKRKLCTLYSTKKKNKPKP